MSGTATAGTHEPGRAWEVTGADTDDLARDLASQTLPKPPKEAIEVSSIAQIGEALDRLQRAQCVEVQLRFAPACPPEVVDFAFNLPKSITEAILRYNEIVAKAGTDSTQPSYGIAAGTKAPMIILRIDPSLGADGILNKTAVVDLSDVDASGAAEAGRSLADLLERAHACIHNPPRLEVEMPPDPAVSECVQTETLNTLHKPETDVEEIKRRLLYLRKRLELLDLIVGGIRLPGTSLLDG